MTTTEEQDHLSTVLAAILAVAVSGTAITVQPGMVQGMVSLLDFSPADAGAVSSFELLGFVGGAIAFAIIGNRIDWFRATLAGGILMVLMNMLSMYLDTYAPFAAARLGAGVGAGLVTGIAWAILAQSTNPARNFAWATMGIIAFSALMFWQLPNIFAGGTYDHFLMVFSICVLVSLGVAFIAVEYKRGISGATEQIGHASVPVMSVVGLISVTSILIFHLGYMAAYTYMSLIGEANGLSAEKQIASALGLSQLAGVAGAFAVAWLGEKIGYLRSTAIVVILGAVGILALTGSLDYPKFLTLNLVFQFCWNSGMPLILGIVALGDRTGGLIKVAVPLQFVGMSAGAALASRIVDSGASFNTVLMVAAVISVLSLLAIGPLGMRIHKDAAAA